MLTSNEQPPDVQSWLLRIAESSSVSPPWQDALTRLSGESTPQERLAVYQAICDSGWLSEDAGLYLVAAHVEEMADAEAAVKLPELDKRMEAMEKEFGNAEGEPWTDERAAEEYDELSQQYQDAWDAIFADILNAAGGREIVRLYATDPDGFARRYAAGQDAFRTPVPIYREGSLDDLVRVASFVNVSQAELARNVLLSEGVSAAVANVNLVLWEWWYSNATGGVSVHVRRADAPLARSVLARKRHGPADHRPPWNCPSCGQRLGGEWEICWRCGHSMDAAPDGIPGQQRTGPAPGVRPSVAAEPGDGQSALVFEAPSPDESPPVAAQQLTRILGSAVILLFVLLPLAVGLVAPAIVNALFAGALIWLMGRFASGTNPPAESREMPELGIKSTFSQTRSNVSKAIVRRAWQAAILGCLGFPPLGIYALWLLWKLAGRKTPLGAADCWRVGLAFVFSLLAVLYCFLFGAGVLIWMLGTRGRPY